MASILMSTILIQIKSIICGLMVWRTLDGYRIFVLHKRNKIFVECALCKEASNCIAEIRNEIRISLKLPSSSHLVIISRMSLLHLFSMSALHTTSLPRGILNLLPNNICDLLRVGLAPVVTGSRHYIIVMHIYVAFMSSGG